MLQAMTQASLDDDVFREDQTTHGKWQIDSWLCIKLSATVSSANWEIGDHNYYRQFAELCQKNHNLLNDNYTWNV